MADILIYSMMGRVVLKTKLAGIGIHELSLADYPEGIYIIRVVSGSRAGTAKILKH